MAAVIARICNAKERPDRQGQTMQGRVQVILDYIVHISSVRCHSAEEARRKVLR